MTVTKKKKKSRIKQTRTSFQKVFDQHLGLVQPFSWSDRLPEVIHISLALINSDYAAVKKDFYTIADFVNKNNKPKQGFHFNLSHTIKLIRGDNKILEQINQTCFKEAFEQLLPFYFDIFQVDADFNAEPNIKFMLTGYKQILDGRSNISVLCKYLMMQYEQQGVEDAFGLFKWDAREDILKPRNVSTTMASFPTLIGIGGNLDVSFCEDMWMHNYLYSMFLPKPDNSKMEEEHFKEMKVEEFSNELKNLYSEFKKINLIAVYPRFIAEINMGFVARICNLTFDIVDFVKCHKGEIADLTFRTTLESFIVGSWLLKKKDIILHQRFRDFSLGKDRLMGEKIVQKATTEKMKKKAKKFIYDAIKDAGRLEIDVASERGDIFDLRIDQMANEVWGEDNEYYYLYKRASETTHGHWRVMAKFHLAKSLNPMHNGLYQYNDNPNRFAGLIPAFKALNIAAAFLLTILDQIESEELSELKKKVKHFKRQAMEEYVKYFNTYIDK